MKTWKECSQEKVIHPDQLETKVLNLRAQGKRLATLNGSFDLLHAGHLYILYEASCAADVLIVALNSDASIRAYKSPNRPIISLPFRMEMLTALAFVDYVTWFEETNPCAILEKIRPDVHVNGAEYGEDCIESDVVKKYGGELHLVKRLPGLATSDVIKKIEGLKCV